MGDQPGAIAPTQPTSFASRHALMRFRAGYRIAYWHPVVLAENVPTAPEGSPVPNVPLKTPFRIDPISRGEPSWLTLVWVKVFPTTCPANAEKGIRVT